MPNKKMERQATEKESAVRSLQRSLRITPLDRLIIDAVVDSRLGVAGALSRQELARAVDEFVDLNGRRQQSYFHAGFRDALFDVPLAAKLPAQNEKRARWYWAGVVQGFARSNSWARIGEAYDSHRTVSELGDGVDAASRRAGICIAEALWRTGRTADLNVFVHVGIARRPDVHELLLAAGTESLRARSPGVARAIFALLMESAESAKSIGPLVRYVPTVRRRMAHCLRLLGEHQSAEELLRGLLRDDGDPDIHAMAHADLGLLKGRFALLDEVRIPDDEAAQHDLVDRLRAGEEHFRDAVANPEATYASHGHYCLGVLALADGSRGEERFEEADRHLERAHAQIRGDQAYPPSLVAQVDLYLGIAKAQLLDAGEIYHAARLVASGLGSATIPSNFIAPTVESLALSDESIAIVAEPLLASDVDVVVDALASTAIAETYAPLSDRLRERAGRPNRRKALVAADLRRALHGYLGVGDIEAARETLDGLEHLAVESFGVMEFLELLDQPDRYEPAWEREDAAVASARCLEVKGQYVEALAQLRGVFHLYMQRGDTHSAAGVLDRVRGYGLERAEFGDLENRYASSIQDDDPEPNDLGNSRPVTVLVVGGNETQARGADRVRSRIARRDPNTSVEFLHTGWSSGWDQYVDETERRLAKCDAVVVMRYIRTLLGKRVRSICRKHEVPWRFCWSGGQGGIVESVLAAAGAGRARREKGIQAD